MLTAVEAQRIKNFTEGMDRNTATAMYHLFKFTKPGCDDAAYELMDVAHGMQEKASARTIRSFYACGLVDPGGAMPVNVKKAIRKAVAKQYLRMRRRSRPKNEAGTSVRIEYNINTAHKALFMEE